MGDTTQAEIIHMKAMAMARKIKDQKLFLIVYLGLANNYLDMKQWNKARLYADSAIKLAAELKDDHSMADMIQLLGSEQYDKKNYAKAKEYYTQYLQGMKNANSQMGISWGFCLLSHTYSSMDRVDSALYYAKQSLDICIQNRFDYADPYDAYYHAYKAAHDYKKALKYYLLYDSCVHVSYNFASGKNVAGVQAKSEQTKKDLIAKLELDKKESEARRTRDIQYTIIAAVLLLALFFYWNSRQKQKAKVKIEKAYSELKSTQAQLIQSEKMASLGELTAGIAHEIQNPLNFVNNFSEVSAELVKEMVEEVDKGNTEEVKAIAGDVVQNLKKINHHGKRAADIVKGMLQHSRSSSGVKEPTDINALADEYLRLAYHGLRAKDKSFNATMNTDFDESIGIINIVPQDIGRVILNLITNAFYVVNEKALSAGATPTAAKYEPTVSVITKKVNGKVEIKVADNGNGITQKILDKIFQPFFTTKPTGQGTGLGLSLSYDIVKAHGGEINVKTLENEGTEFTVMLPA
jgi:signal transduction histidine kinase